MVNVENVPPLTDPSLLFAFFRSRPAQRGLHISFTDKESQRIVDNKTDLKTAMLGVMTRQQRKLFVRVGAACVQLNGPAKYGPVDFWLDFKATGQSAAVVLAAKALITAENGWTEAVFLSETVKAKGRQALRAQLASRYSNSDPPTPAGMSQASPAELAKDVVYAATAVDNKRLLQATADGWHPVDEVEKPKGGQNARRLTNILQEALNDFASAESQEALAALSTAPDKVGFIYDVLKTQQAKPYPQFTTHPLYRTPFSSCWDKSLGIFNAFDDVFLVYPKFERVLARFGPGLGLFKAWTYAGNLTGTFTVNHLEDLMLPSTNTFRGLAGYKLWVCTPWAQLPEVLELYAKEFRKGMHSPCFHRWQSKSEAPSRELRAKYGLEEYFFEQRPGWQMILEGGVLHEVHNFGMGIATAKNFITEAWMDVVGRIARRVADACVVNRATADELGYILRWADAADWTARKAVLNEHSVRFMAGRTGET